MQIHKFNIEKRLDGGFRAGCVRFDLADVTAVLERIDRNAADASKYPKLKIVKSVSKMRHGQWFCGMFAGRAIIGKISIGREGFFHMCQNEPDMDGDNDDGKLDKLGFEYSWISREPAVYHLLLYDKDPIGTGEFFTYRSRLLATTTPYQTNLGTKTFVTDKCVHTAGYMITKRDLERLRAYLMKQK